MLDSKNSRLHAETIAFRAWSSRTPGTIEYHVLKKYLCVGIIWPINTFQKRDTGQVVYRCLPEHRIGSSAVGCGRARPRPTAMLPQRSNGKTGGCYCSCWAPDDGREDARNVLSRLYRPDHDQQHCYHHVPKAKPEAATAVGELLMMGVRMPETCWAVNKHQVKWCRNCCI